MTSDRLSQQHQVALDKAHQFQLDMQAIAQRIEEGQQQETQGKAEGQKTFFLTLFRVAAEHIERDVQEFCDRAADVFEEIEAHGQEPTIDEGWLSELTGENDNFYFSTDSLISQPPPIPGRKRGRKPKPLKELNEAEVVKAVQAAIEEAEAHDVPAISHQENSSDWIARIATALKQNQGAASFERLQHTTGLSPGALFLGLLLGHERWGMSQSEFYGQVLVQLRE